jgi:hypothetical protein
MHDSRIFEMSSLSRVIEEKLRDTNYHLLGDSAYRLGIRLITPYRDNGHLTPVIMFNTKFIQFKNFFYCLRLRDILIRDTADKDV